MKYLKHSQRQWVFCLQQRVDHFHNENRIFICNFKVFVLLDHFYSNKLWLKTVRIPKTVCDVACFHRRIRSDCFPCAVRVEANAAWRTSGGHPVNITRVRMTRLCPPESSSTPTGHRRTERWGLFAVWIHSITILLKKKGKIMKHRCKVCEKT